MAKLHIDFFDDSDTRWAHIIFRQEGMRGYFLDLCWLPEFIAGLESPNNSARLCMYENYFVHNTKTSCTLSVSSREDPLLQLDAGQRDKLIAHLKQQYKQWL
jgi:hypothetical protein